MYLLCIRIPVGTGGTCGPGHKFKFRSSCRISGYCHYWVFVLNLVLMRGPPYELSRVSDSDIKCDQAYDSFIYEWQLIDPAGTSKAYFREGY
eukprot:SAG31_NODE_279_length_18600_cov_21.254527_16_plen_92_part_00